MRCFEKGYYRITYKIHPEGAIEPAFGYVLYAVMSGDKAYYTLRAIDVLFFYVAGPLSIALLAFLVIYNFKKR